MPGLDACLVARSWAVASSWAAAGGAWYSLAAVASV